MRIKQSIENTGAVFLKQPVILNPNGNLRRIFRSIDGEKLPFREIYYSEVNRKSLKGWKYHRQQTQNISVAYGEIRVVCVLQEIDREVVEVFKVDTKHFYGVLTIPAGIYYAIINYTNEPTILLNVTDNLHDPAENKSLPIDTPVFQHLIRKYGVFE